MNFTATNALAIIALILAVIGVIKPSWSVTAIAVLLLAIAVLIGSKA